jgi:hypothetical protein
MTAIPRWRNLAIASMLVLVFAPGVRGGTAETPKLQPGVFIYENDFGHLCEILEVGNSLAFGNEKGEWSWGTSLNPTRRVEVAAGGGWAKIGGTVSDDGNVIRWDSNVTWRRLKWQNLWVYENDFDHLCETVEAGTDSVAFRNEKGEWSWGKLLSSTRRIEVAAGGGWSKIGGTLTDDGKVIRWDSSLTWRRITKYSSPQLGNGNPSRPSQRALRLEGSPGNLAGAWIGDGDFTSPHSIYYIDGRSVWFATHAGAGQYSAGVIDSPTQVRAIDWRNPDGTAHHVRRLKGIVSEEGRTITWENGSVWRRYEGTEIWIGDRDFASPHSIARAGRWVWIVTHAGVGQYSAGVVDSPTQVRAIDWRNPDGTAHPVRSLKGTVSEEGRTITWENGSVWRMRWPPHTRANQD